MNTIPITSYGDVPWAVFEEFVDQESVMSSTKTDGKGRLSISIGDVSDSSFIDLSLVHLDYTCPDGKYSFKEIKLFGGQVEFNMFNLYGNTTRADPLVSIMSAPKYPEDTSKTPWIKKRGFWITEGIDVSLGGGSTPIPGTVNMFHEPEQDLNYMLVIEIQRQAYKLGSQVLVRGHWEADWNPKGTYLIKPSKI